MPRPPASWIIVRRSDRAAVFETFDPRTAAAVNRKVYDVVPVSQWLASLSKRA